LPFRGVRTEEDISPMTLRPLSATSRCPFGSNRSLEPASSLPQPAWRLDNDFSKLYPGEMLVAVETLNVDAASFRQMEEASGSADGVAALVLQTVRDRGKQHNPKTGSGGMLLGRVLQISPERPADSAKVGDRIASLVSLSLTPLHLSEILATRAVSAQLDVRGEAVLFATSPYAILPTDMPERLSLAVLDVAGAAPQAARLVANDHVVVILGAGGKSGILCAIEARRRGGPQACIVGIEAHAPYAEELRALQICDAVVTADATDPLAVRAAVLAATAGREADVTFSCINVEGAELSAILVTKDRGVAYFFAMSTSFTRAALGAEGVGKDIDLMIGNGFANGHADHSLAMMREFPALRALFERRYT
jgi:L-erythro-3,5-diaminohexanoate dehydrogenase